VRLSEKGELFWIQDKEEQKKNWQFRPGKTGRGGSVGEAFLKLIIMTFVNLSL
jgi:hypothetical protein